MKIIILTTNLVAGISLKEKLKRIDKMFKSIDCLSDDFIKKNPKICTNTKYIFSTWNMPFFSEEEIKNYFPSLKAIFYAAGSVKYFAEPFMKCGVRIFSSYIANAIPVAEFVLAQILLANKGYFQAAREYKKPFWKISFKKARIHTLNKKGNYKSKIGVIGYGAIGSKVVELLKPFEFEVFVCDPNLSLEFANKINVIKCNLKEIFIKCDVITNHLPDIQKTKGIINFKLLSLMKDNATFINTGRGAQVVENDLEKVMSDKPSACALLDVTQIEPIKPRPFKWRKSYFKSC